MNRLRLFAFSTVTLCLLQFRALAGNVPPPTEPYDLRGAATYSDICVHEETGDLLGVRVFLRASDRSPRIVVQFAEGELAEPEAATAWSTNGRLMFALGHDLEGEVYDHFMIARSSFNAGKPFRLSLRDDTHGFPDCLRSSDGLP